MKISLSASTTVTYRLYKGDIHALRRFITGQNNEGVGQLIIKFQVALKWHEIRIAGFDIEYYPWTRSVRGYKK